MLSMSENENGRHVISDSRDTERRRKHIRIAKTQMLRRAHASAERMLHKVVNAEPTCAESVRLLATVYATTERTVEARALLCEGVRVVDEALGCIDDGGLKLDWNNNGARELLRLWIACARTLNDAGRRDEALRLIERCVRTDTLDHVCARLELLASLIESARMDEAAQYAEEFTDDTHPGVLYTMVLALAGADHAHAEVEENMARWAQKAVERAPEFGRWVAKGATQSERARYGRELENQAKARTGHLWRHSRANRARECIRVAYNAWLDKERTTDEKTQGSRGLWAIATTLGLHAWAEQEHLQGTPTQTGEQRVS